MPCGWKCTARSERRVFSTTIGCAPSLAYSHIYSCTAMEPSHTAQMCKIPQRKMLCVNFQGVQQMHRCEIHNTLPQNAETWRVVIPVSSLDDGL